MSDPSQSSPAAGLQFDRVEPAASAPAPAEGSGIPCTSCGSSIRLEYFSVRGKSICGRCRASIERSRMKSRSPRAFAKALGFGLGASIAGAAVYYAVIALLDLEIGIVAILIGWMVGRAIQKALPGGGMRRYQILAAMLTYFAVGLAYMPVLFGAMRKGAEKAHQTASVVQQGAPAAGDSVAKATDSVAASKVVVRKASGRSIALALGALVLLAFSLPVMAAFASGSGILSALIIGIGIRQAWRMTGAPDASIAGPFRVGSAPA